MSSGVSLLITIIVNVKRGLLLVARRLKPLMISFFYIKMLCAFVRMPGHPAPTPQQAQREAN